MSPFIGFHKVDTWFGIKWLSFGRSNFLKPWLSKLTKSEYILSISFASRILSSSFYRTIQNFHFNGPLESIHPPKFGRPLVWRALACLARSPSHHHFSTTNHHEGFSNFYMVNSHHNRERKRKLVAFCGANNVVDHYYGQVRHSA